jgi:LysM repeat protein
MLAAAPLFVHAGIFPSFLYATDKRSAAYIDHFHKSASPVDAPALFASIHPDPLGARGGAEIIIKDGALVSSGPVGEDIIATSRLTNGEISVYTVREGDSLSQIAQMYGVTTNTILWANDLKKTTDIRPGDSLVILPIVGVRHTVKSGDTISKLATRYRGDADEILAYNQLEAGAPLVVGDTIIIPGGVVSTPPPMRAAAPSRAPAVSSGADSDGGLFAHPLPGSVRTQGLHGFNGVDLAAPLGTPIRAAAAGEVIVSKTGGWNGGYGNYIVIRHPNGMQTLYAHNQSNLVGVGAYVAEGEIIARVGTTGRSTGPHLHFEVRGGRNPF